MAALATTATSANSSGIATVEEIRAAFTEHRQELTWLAEFLTGDEMVASACVIDARVLTERAERVFQEWLWTWPWGATIRSAIDVQQARIAQLASACDLRGCFHGQHGPLPPEMVEFVVREAELVRLRLDALCRFSLILCGVEQRSAHEAALLLGVSKRAVEGAYCAALESLEIIHCLVTLESAGGAAVPN